MIYYVDYENIGKDFFRGLDKLKSNDELIVVCSNPGRTYKPSIDECLKMRNYKGKFSFVKSPEGVKESRDKTIIRLVLKKLFSLPKIKNKLTPKSNNVCQKPEKKIAILSKDKGYEPMIKMMDKSGYVCYGNNIEDVSKRLK